MFRFLAKSALATLIWKRYRRTIVATLVLLAGYFLIAMIHSDYVDYTHSAGDTRYLWLSYLVKWAALIGATAIYYLVIRRALTPEVDPLAERESHRARNRTRGANAPSGEPQSAGGQDPFAHIRRKNTLKSRGDTAIEQTKNK